MRCICITAIVLLMVKSGAASDKDCPLENLRGLCKVPDVKDVKNAYKPGETFDCQCDTKYCKADKKSNMTCNSDGKWYTTQRADGTKFECVTCEPFTCAIETSKFHDCIKTRGLRKGDVAGCVCKTSNKSGTMECKGNGEWRITEALKKCEEPEIQPITTEKPTFVPVTSRSTSNKSKCSPNGTQDESTSNSSKEPLEYTTNQRNTTKCAEAENKIVACCIVSSKTTFVCIVAGVSILTIALILTTTATIYDMQKSF